MNFFFSVQLLSFWVVLGETHTPVKGLLQVWQDSLHSGLESQLVEDVVLVEDIVDSGKTARFLIKHLELQQPSSIRLCSLLSKPSKRKFDVPIDYLGFEVPDKFIVGYGLDFNQSFRNLPYIGVIRS